MYTFLLHCFLYNFFSTAALFHTANCFKQPHESYNDISSLEISGAIAEYALQRLEGKPEMMSDTQIHLLDWFLHRHFIRNSMFSSTVRLLSVTRLKCLNHPSPEASIEFLEIMADYLNTQIIFHSAGGSNAAGPVVIRDQSVHTAGGSNAAGPSFIRGQSSVPNSGGSNAAGPSFIRGVSHLFLMLADLMLLSLLRMIRYPICWMLHSPGHTKCHENASLLIEEQQQKQCLPTWAAVKIPVLKRTSSASF